MGVAICDAIGREQKVVAINESRLYSLTLSMVTKNGHKNS